MKQPNKPTRSQKEIISNNNLNWQEWFVISDLGSYLKIIKVSSMNTNCPQIKIIEKTRRRTR